MQLLRSILSCYWPPDSQHRGRSWLEASLTTIPMHVVARVSSRSQVHILRRRQPEHQRAKGIQVDCRSKQVAASAVERKGARTCSYGSARKGEEYAEVSAGIDLESRSAPRGCRSR